MSVYVFTSVSSLFTLEIFNCIVQIKNTELLQCTCCLTSIDKISFE